jgi:hypothetical protein
MKSVRFMLFAVVISLSAVAFAQSDAQKAFDKLKTLAGSWTGTYEGTPLHVSIRVTSTGNAVMHEMTGAERPEVDPDHPLTVFYVEGDRLLLTHYCDVGNRPRMAWKMTPDGKTLEFDFLDIANYSSAQGSHMHNAVFTLLDPNHHTEEWTSLREGKPPIVGRLDLHRGK